MITMLTTGISSILILLLTLVAQGPGAGNAGAASSTPTPSPTPTYFDLSQDEANEVKTFNDALAKQTEVFNSIAESLKTCDLAKRECDPHVSNYQLTTARQVQIRLAFQNLELRVQKRLKCDDCYLDFQNGKATGRAVKQPAVATPTVAKP